MKSSYFIELSGLFIFTVCMFSLVCMFFYYMSSDPGISVFALILTVFMACLGIKFIKEWNNNQ